MNKQMKKELVTYLDIRFKYLREFSTSVEGFFDKEYKRYALQSKTNKSIRRALHDIVVNMTTLRYCMIVSVCSFVEEFLKNLSSLIVPDYHKKIGKYKRERASEFKKHIKLIKSDTGKDFAPIKSEIDFFEDIITVRNAIVHAWGKVDKVRNSKRVETIIKKCDWIQKTADGYVFLEDQAVKKMLIATIEIVRHICSII